MENIFSFRVEKKRGLARAGVISTPHGQIQTPMFMPVGTAASVKSLDSSDLEEAGAQVILGNTYHLYFRPGQEVIKSSGGLHRFMKWSKPILTDSGGFQVFSLGAQLIAKQALQQAKNTPAMKPVKITDEGVEFYSFLDGSKHFFSPEKAIEIQQVLGSDIIMAFDHCTPDEATRSEAESALTRTQNWAEQCLRAWERKGRASHYGQYQALFGIIQGAKHQDLRMSAAKFIDNLAFDGLAIGGETIGYNMLATRVVMEWIRPLLSEAKPRYTMGLGLNPQDIIDAVWLGVDMFDCVAPTRLARNGALYSGRVEYHPNSSEMPVMVSEFANCRLSISASQYASDQRPIDEHCDCATCGVGYSRAYLRHLYKAKELSYYRLASIHNVRFMIRLVEKLRNWIEQKTK